MPFKTNFIWSAGCFLLLTLNGHIILQTVVINYNCYIVLEFHSCSNIMHSMKVFVVQYVDCISLLFLNDLC